MKKIKINKIDIDCRVRKSKLAKNMRLSVGANGVLSVTIPRFFPMMWVKSFIVKNADWVIRSIDKAKQRKVLKSKKYQESKEEARRFIHDRLNHYAEQYGFSFNRVSIRDQKSRWGSCSAEKNLNFNYRILFLPAELADYVIVHELCHLHEMNHSPRFWKLVTDIIPDCKKRRRELKKMVF